MPNIIGGQILEYSESTGRLVPVPSISGPLNQMDIVGAVVRKLKKKAKRKPKPRKVDKSAAAKRILKPKGVKNARRIYHAAKNGNKKAITSIARLRKIGANKKKPVSAAVAKSALEVMKEEHQMEMSPAGIPFEQSERIEEGSEAAFVPVSDAAPTDEEFRDMAPTRQYITEEQAVAEEQDLQTAVDEIEDEPEEPTDEMTDEQVGACIGIKLVKGIKKVGRKVGRATKKVVPAALAPGVVISIKAIAKVTKGVRGKIFRAMFRKLISRRASFIAWQNRKTKNPTPAEKAQAVTWALAYVKSKGILGKFFGTALSGNLDEMVLGDAAVTAAAIPVLIALAKHVLAMAQKEGAPDPTSYGDEEEYE